MAMRAAEVLGVGGEAPALILCEHASCNIPAQFGDLGLSDAARKSHIAWDPGAAELARALAGAMRLPAVLGGVSRLIYDCNRPPEAPDAIPQRVETYEIPGNAALDDDARAARVAQVYRPFCAAVDAAMSQHKVRALITVHSFTPVWHGAARAVEIGVLHDRDTRLAAALMARLTAAGSGHDIRLNEPYGARDGVTHSLRIHAQARGLPNAMLELRNDLLRDAAGVAAIAALLAPALNAALADCGVRAEGVA